VLIIDGGKHSRRSPGDGLRLAERLVCAGALVTHHVLPVGHSITAEDERTASEWLRAIEHQIIPGRRQRASVGYPGFRHPGRRSFISWLTGNGSQTRCRTARRYTRDDGRTSACSSCGFAFAPAAV
jgi:hypothetical protein